MRPDFIPADKFRAHLKTQQLNQWALIDGIQPSSYVARCDRLGKPIRHYTHEGRKYWRLLDIIARARAEGATVEPTLESRAEKEIYDLKEKNAAFAQEIETLRCSTKQAAHILSMQSLSTKLTGATLLSELAIVSAKLSLPARSGIYFLIKGMKVVYVGQSRSVFSRVSDHLKTKDFDGFSYIECHESILDILESLYIHVLSPPLNGKWTGGQGVHAPFRLDELISAAARGRLIMHYKPKTDNIVGRPGAR